MAESLGLQEGATLPTVHSPAWPARLPCLATHSAAPLQVCTTLGMLTPEQAQQLRTAGLTAYNHNLDTSPEFYPRVTSSRKYEVSRGVHLLWGCQKQKSMVSQPVPVLDRLRSRLTPAGLPSAAQPLVRTA